MAEQSSINLVGTTPPFLPEKRGKARVLFEFRVA